MMRIGRLHASMLQPRNLKWLNRNHTRCKHRDALCSCARHGTDGSVARRACVAATSALMMTPISTGVHRLPGSDSREGAPHNIRACGSFSHQHPGCASRASRAHPPRQLHHARRLASPPLQARCNCTLPSCHDRSATRLFHIRSQWERIELRSDRRQSPTVDRPHGKRLGRVSRRRDTFHASKGCGIARQRCRAQRARAEPQASHIRHGEGVDRMRCRATPAHGSTSGWPLAASCGEQRLGA